jgi:protein required for attachment to host cells
MEVPHGAVVIVADGGRARAFRQTGRGLDVALEPMGGIEMDTHNHSSGVRRRPDEGGGDANELDEDARAASVAEWVNAEVTAGRITGLVVIAAPKTLGEMRHHWSSGTQGVIAGEISKDLSNHDLKGITDALKAA